MSAKVMGANLMQMGLAAMMPQPKASPSKSIKKSLKKSKHKKNRGDKKDRGDKEDRGESKHKKDKIKKSTMKKTKKMDISLYACTCVHAFVRACALDGECV
jgi:hypothetical protein